MKSPSDLVANIRCQLLWFCSRITVKTDRLLWCHKISSVGVLVLRCGITFPFSSCQLLQTCHGFSSPYHSLQKLLEKEHLKY